MEPSGRAAAATSRTFWLVGGSALIVTAAIAAVDAVGTWSAATATKLSASGHMFHRRGRHWAVEGQLCGRRRHRCKRRKGRVRALQRRYGTYHLGITEIHGRDHRRRRQRRTAVFFCLLFILATRRIGEASNPGPRTCTYAMPDQDVDLADATIRAEVIDASWNQVISYPRPHRDGFRGAVAPGLEDTDHERVRRGADGLRLRVESINSSGWGPLKRRLQQTQAHSVLAQETWVLDWQVPSARRWARRHGWTSLWAPAATGKGGGASGGTAIFVRKEMGLRGPDVGSHVVADARIVLGVAEFPGHRPVLLNSTYLVDGAKMGKANADLLDRLSKAVVAQGPHYMVICGGDFQNPPDHIAHHDGMRTMRTRVVASESPRGTFRTSRSASNLDFFAVSENLAMAIDGVELQEGTGNKAHIPVPIVFKERPIGLQTLALRMPPPLPTERLYGPLEPELDWSNVAAAADVALAAARAAESTTTVQSKLNAAYSAWCDMAERDLIRVTGAPPQSAAPEGNDHKSGGGRCYRRAGRKAARNPAHPSSPGSAARHGRYIASTPSSTTLRAASYFATRRFEEVTCRTAAPSRLRSAVDTASTSAHLLAAAPAVGDPGRHLRLTSALTSSAKCLRNWPTVNRRPASTMTSLTSTPG